MITMIEGYYLETQEQLFFAVKGFEHPPDRVIAVLRYVPDPVTGDRKKGSTLYRRYYHFPEQVEFLQTKFPEYLAYLPVFQTTLQSIPRSRVLHIYDPRQRLQQIMESPAPTALEKDAADCARILQSQARVPQAAIGISGSLLIGMDTDQSDLDLVVFGQQSCEKVHQALSILLDTQSQPELRRFDMQGFQELYAARAPDTQMDFCDFIGAEKTKVNQGRFRQRTYFIRFVKDVHESGATYGDRIYFAIGRVRISATVMDDRDSIFTPCRYGLADVHVWDGPQVTDLKEIVSFRGRFCEQAKTGDRVSAAGTLERVQVTQGAVWHRLIIGNSPQDGMVSGR